jgi:hypothetical protein
VVKRASEVKDRRKKKATTHYPKCFFNNAAWYDEPHGGKTNYFGRSLIILLAINRLEAVSCTLLYSVYTYIARIRKLNLNEVSLPQLLKK